MADARGAAFDDFVRSRSVPLLRVAYLLTGDRHAAEDLLQEVLEQLYVRRRRVHAWKAGVPVRLELPDGQGILVAAEGKRISYRLNGAVHDAGRNAALLPAAAQDITAS